MLAMALSQNKKERGIDSLFLVVLAASEHYLTVV
jgi:hypothetical protein